MGIGNPGAETLVPQRLVETLTGCFAWGEQGLCGGDFWSASRSFDNCSEKFTYANTHKEVVETSELLSLMVLKDVDFFQLVILWKKWPRAVCDTLTLNAVLMCVPCVCMSQSLGCLAKLWIVTFASVLWKMLSWKHLLYFRYLSKAGKLSSFGSEFL